MYGRTPETGPLEVGTCGVHFSAIHPVGLDPPAGSTRQVRSLEACVPEEAVVKTRPAQVRASQVSVVEIHVSQVRTFQVQATTPEEGSGISLHRSDLLTRFPVKYVDRFSGVRAIRLD